MPCPHFIDRDASTTRMLRLRARVLRGGASDSARSRAQAHQVRAHRARGLNPDNPFIRGTAQNPMTTPEVDEKCYDLMAPVLGKARARKLCDTVWNIEKVKDVRALRPLLRA